MRLIPNLGAEEGPTDPDQPILDDPIRAWSWLFGAGATVAWGKGPIPWPASLGTPPPGPAFPWIAGAGAAWLGTEEAGEALSAEGIEGAFPPPEVVRHVNDKAFSQEVARAHGLQPPCLRDHLAVLDPEDLNVERVRELVEALPPWTGGEWMLKPRLGTSGRGRVRLLPHVPGALPRLRARGGAIFEPWLRRIEDLSALLHVGRDGALTWVGTTRQLLRGAGVYLGNRGLYEGGVTAAGTRWDEPLREAAEILGSAAARAGYFGPLGLDAFVFEGPGGEPVLRPVVEVNARYTMGFVAVGLLRRAIAAGAIPEAGAWLYSLRERREGEGALPLGGAASLLWGENPAAIDRRLAW